MNKQLALGLAAVTAAGVLGGAVAVSANDDEAERSKVTTKVSSLDFSNKKFHGKLKLDSPDEYPDLEYFAYGSAQERFDDAVESCKSDRKVVVHKEKRRGKDPKVGSAVSNDDGKWHTRKVKKKAGKYYASVDNKSVKEMLIDYGVVVKCSSDSANYKIRP